MGQFKQLLRMGDRSFVEHCVDNLLASRVEEVIVVTGHRASEVTQAVGDRPVSFAHNADYRSGMASSIKCGVQALSEQTRAFVLALVDQPQIRPDVINRIIETFENTGAIIVIPTYQDKNGHPILLDVTLKDEILAFDPGLGLRQVVHAHLSEISRVEVNTGTVLEDFDWPEDYTRVLKQ